MAYEDGIKTNGVDPAPELKALGSKKTTYTFSGPKSEMLETFPSPTSKSYVIVHKTKEFSSLCPKTGQPDFATIIISIIPDKRCVETKSLKLYLFSFRNEGAFMEAIINKITEDIAFAIQPIWLRVEGRFGARGGVKTTVSRTFAVEGSQVDEG